MKSNCHKLLFTMTYAKRFCEHNAVCTRVWQRSSCLHQVWAMSTSYVIFSCVLSANHLIKNVFHIVNLFRGHFIYCAFGSPSWMGVERLWSFRGRPSYKQQCRGWQQETLRTRRQGPSWFLPPRHHLQVGVRTCQEQGGAVRGWKLVSCQDFKDSEGSEDENEAERTSC